MTKKQLKQQLAEQQARIAQLLKQAATYKDLTAKVEAVEAKNAKLLKAVMKVNDKAIKMEWRNRRLKARLTQVTMQLEILAEANIMVRGELIANIHAIDYKTERVKQSYNRVKHEGGKLPAEEVEPEGLPRVVKRFGLNGSS